jgi:hypothetical protein
MSRRQLLAVMAGVFVSLTSAAADRAEAAKFNVYYRNGASAPWVYYAGKDTLTAAETASAELKEMGYLTQVLADAAPSPPTVTAPTVARQSVVPVGVGTYVDGGRYVGGTGRVVTVGNSVSRSHYLGHAGTYYAAGSTVGSAHTHHYGHAHHHHHGKNHHVHHHPTHHPHHNLHHHHHSLNHHHAHHHAHNGHHHHHARHHGGHHAHHHGGHHAHHHAHHHSHGHHHR